MGILKCTCDEMKTQIKNRVFTHDDKGLRIISSTLWRSAIIPPIKRCPWCGKRV